MNRRVIFCLLFACLASCGGRGAEDPHSVLRDYAAALDEGRADDAYRMLSDDARRGISIEAFRRIMRDSPDEARELAKALRRPASPALVTATMTAPDGQELSLVYEKGAWRVEATAIDLYAQDTPRNAVRSFARALERKRYEVMLRFIPEAQKTGLDAKTLKDAWEGAEKDDMAKLLASIKQSLPSARIEETGDSATFVHATGTMVLVREGGVWKVDVFD